MGAHFVIVDIPLCEHIRIHEIFILDYIIKYGLHNYHTFPLNHMLWLSIRITSAYDTTFDFMEKLPRFNVIIPTPHFPRFYYMLNVGANLG